MIFIMNGCAVFDFDCTITYSNFYNLINNYKKYTEEFQSVMEKFGIAEKDLYRITTDWSLHKMDLLNLVFGGIERFQLITEFFRSLTLNKYDIYISSRGNCDQIHNILDFFDLLHYIKIINANYNDKRCVLESKDRFIEKLGDKYTKIIYIDDVDDEHRVILTNGKLHNKYMYFGQNIKLYSNKNGLDKTMINTILNRLGLINVPNLPNLPNLPNGLNPVHNIQKGGTQSNQYSSGRYYKKYAKYKIKYLNDV